MQGVEQKVQRTKFGAQSPSRRADGATYEVRRSALAAAQADAAAEEAEGGASRTALLSTEAFLATELGALGLEEAPMQPLGCHSAAVALP